MNDNEVIYIATDENNQELFDDFKPRFRIRFLSDYYERAGVSELNPNLIGMLEQVRPSCSELGLWTNLCVETVHDRCYKR